MCAKLLLLLLSHLSRVAKLLQLCPTTFDLTEALQAPLSMRFSKQEYWSGLPFPSPGDLPDPWIESVFPMSPALVGKFFTTSATWGHKAASYRYYICFACLFWPH